MSKELTLEELAASSKPKREQPKKNIVSEDPKNGAIKMSAHDVEQAMIKSGKIKPKEEEVVEPPLVDNAFQSMNTRLQQSKDWIENTMMPIVRENAREMALEAELGESDEEDMSENDTVDSGAANVNGIPDIDDRDFLDEEEYLMGRTKPDEDTDDDDDVDIFNDDNKNNDEEQTESSSKVYKFEGKQQESKAPVKEVEVPVEKEVVEEPKKESTNAPRVALQATEDVEESGDLDELMKDLEADELNVVDTEEETPEEIRARFKHTFEQVKITSDPIDLSKFTIQKKPVDSSLVLAAIQNGKTTKKADWGLYYTKRPVTFTECYGPELDTLRKNIQNANGVNGVIASLKFVYEHIEDANKPKFEAWTKLIRTEDIESLYFGIYRACYSTTNLIARICPTGDDYPKTNCGKTSLIQTPIDDMVKYGITDEDKPEEIKKEFLNIINGDTTTENDAFQSTLMQISDDIVISYSPATLYSTFIQYSTLKPEITQKYSDILNTMAYIDGFFHINRFDNQLVPIEIKEYPKNFNKTILAKLKVYTEILKSLTNDQYNILTAKLENMIQPPKVHYVYPKSVCPECGAEIPEENVDSVLNLLFTRAQLAQIKSL